MTAIAFAPPLDRAADAAADVARLNDRLAAFEAIPEDVVPDVHGLAGAVLAPAERWHAIDPEIALRIHRAVIDALEAVHERETQDARDRLRIALERVRQGLSAIDEIEPVSDERSTKELTAWLLETTEVSQARLAKLLGVSLRQVQRWLSPSERAKPEGADAGG